MISFLFFICTLVIKKIISEFLLNWKIYNKFKNLTYQSTRETWEMIFESTLFNFKFKHLSYQRDIQS